LPDHVVVGIGDDAQFVAQVLQLLERCHHLRKRRHGADAVGQGRAIAVSGRQAQLFQRQLQTQARQGAKAAVRRDLFQGVFMVVVDADQGLAVDLMLTLFIEYPLDGGAQALVPLDQRAVAVKGQPQRARGVFE